MIVELTKIFDRDLVRLKEEINAFQHEENLWVVRGSVKNPAGNLCLHLVGNLRTYVGQNIGGVAYTRDREAEFASRGLSKETLAYQVDDTRQLVVSAIQSLTHADLEKTYVQEVFGYPMTTGFFLLHLTTHLAYHLGQINYLRRILEGGV